MFELTDERRKTLKSFFVNAGTVSLAGLVIGSFARPEGFHLPSFLAGCMMYLSAVACCWVLDGEKEKEV